MAIFLEGRLGLRDRPVGLAPVFLPDGGDLIVVACAVAESDSGPRDRNPSAAQPGRESPCAAFPAGILGHVRRALLLQLRLLFSADLAAFLSGSGAEVEAN